MGQTLQMSIDKLTAKEFKTRKASNQAALRNRRRQAAIMCGFKTVTELVNAILSNKVKVTYDTNKSNY